MASVSAPIQKTYNGNNHNVATAPSSKIAFSAVMSETKSIIQTGLSVVFPMLLLPAILIGFVFHYQVRPTEDIFSFYREGQPDNSTYYVNFSATNLTTLASWSSLLANVSVGYAMVPGSFGVSAIILRNSVKGDPEQLATPYQHILLLGMNTGNWMEL